MHTYKQTFSKCKTVTYYYIIFLTQGISKLFFLIFYISFQYSLIFLFSCKEILLTFSFIKVIQIFRYKIRRVIIILFIIFEVTSQVLFTRNLYKFRNELNAYINSTILKIKIYFITIILFFTSIVFVLLVTDQLDTHHKHMLEWNYFSLLLVFL